MNIEQFEDLLGDLGENMEQLPGSVREYLTRMVTQIQNAAPSDTGALKRSIQLTGDQFGFEISMNFYGIFQNYGVLGTRSSRQPVNPAEAGLSIGTFGIPAGERFSFKENSRAWGVKYTGIRARSFFSIADITDGLREVIQQNLDID